MSYSSLNDAFNINSDFEKTIRGLNSFNPMNNSSETISHFESNYFGDVKGKNCDPNYQNNFYNPNDPLPIIDGMYSGDDNLSWESLNGTDLNSRGDNISSSNKLTHRDCIKIYSNPDSYNDKILSQALKHVSKCKDCKENIKNTILTNEIKKNSKSNSTSQQNNITKSTHNNMKKNININNDNTNLLSAYQQFHNPINSGSLNLSTQSNTQSNIQSNTQSNTQALTNSKIESELKVLSEKINGESNLKYQNALIQNNISKYLEDLEERKKINQKLDNILEMIKSDYISKQDYNRDSKTNVNIETRDNNLMNILTSPQFLLNLSKINDLLKTNEQQVSNIISTTTSSSSTSFESYLLYISIFIIIVLLIIDIVLRLSTKSD